MKKIFIITLTIFLLNLHASSQNPSHTPHKFKKTLESNGRFALVSETNNDVIRYLPVLNGFAYCKDSQLAKDYTHKPIQLFIPKNLVSSLASAQEIFESPKEEWGNYELTPRLCSSMAAFKNSNNNNSIQYSFYKNGEEENIFFSKNNAISNHEHTVACYVTQEELSDTTSVIQFKRKSSTPNELPFRHVNLEFTPEDTLLTIDTQNIQKGKGLIVGKKFFIDTKKPYEEKRFNIVPLEVSSSISPIKFASRSQQKSKKISCSIFNLSNSQSPLGLIYTNDNGERKVIRAFNLDETMFTHLNFKKLAKQCDSNPNSYIARIRNLEDGTVTVSMKTLPQPI